MYSKSTTPLVINGDWSMGFWLLLDDGVVDCVRKYGSRVQHAQNQLNYFIQKNFKKSCFDYETTTEEFIVRGDHRNLLFTLILTFFKSVEFIFFVRDEDICSLLLL
ncbi:hypothetical protein PanWU01x14_126390, partial [Parasponia andersonii]